MKDKLLALVMTGIISAVAHADNVTQVDMGHQTLRVSQPLNVVFSRQAVTIPALCHNHCSGVTVKWSALAPLLPVAGTASGVYLFDSGMKGIAVQVEAPEGVVPADEPLHLNVGLVKTSEAVDAGIMGLSTPLLQWTLVSKGDAVLPQTHTHGQLVVGGTLTVGSCEPTTGTLMFALPSVPVENLKHTTPGQPVVGAAASQSIKITCTPGIATSLSATFLAPTPEGNPSIILSDNNDSVGFMMLDDVYHQTIYWDKSHPLVYPIPPTGQTLIPLTVHYTPTGKPMQAGKVAAQAQFTINYQ